MNNSISTLLKINSSYQCQGQCNRTFNISKETNLLIMDYRMRKEYLNDLYLEIKEYIRSISKSEEIDESLPVCGNCVSYIWGSKPLSHWDRSTKQILDRHYGKCELYASESNKADSIRI